MYTKKNQPIKHKIRLAFYCLFVVAVVFVASNVRGEDFSNKALSVTYEELPPTYEKDKKNVIPKIKSTKSKTKWEKKRFATKIPVKKTGSDAKPPGGKKIKLKNTPKPPEFSNYGLSAVRDFLAGVFLPKAAHAANVIIDGDLSDWSIDDRINLPLDLPPYLATGDEIYGKYIATPTPVYVIALKSTSAAIGANTTFWLNIDQNASTGYQVWGSYSGAEYFINLYTDSTPHLYNSGFQWITSLSHAYNADHTILEVAIPVASLAPLVPPQSIDILGDINDTTLLFPQDWPTGGQYTIAGEAPAVLPARTDFSKRVGIVYCDASKDNFFDPKAYSQLFMSLQHQSMMAGISFSLISHDALINIANIVNYDALVFSYCANIPADQLDQIHDTLYMAIYNYGIGIITADNWLTNDEDGVAIPGDSYRYMKQLLGIGRENGEGPVDINLNAADISHYMMRHYTANEPIVNYQGDWFSYYGGVPGQNVVSLASQTVTGSMAGTYPAVLATETGGRNVHFANLGFLGDSNLAWQAIQWVIYGDVNPVALKMGRNESLFITRIDMDQSQEHDEVPLVEIPLLNLLQDWKNTYGYVASSYINIGNNPAIGQYTDWQVSAPLYQRYVALGNEIGTHSYTHPHFTDLLTPAEIKLEFDVSMNEIITQVGSTWRNQSVRGGAVPGAPESLETAVEINQWLEYLTGGYSSFGAGYPGAHGSLTPNDANFYFSPNMSFDFTLLFFGVPVGNPPVPVPLTSEEGTQYWADEYSALSSHANQPIIVWPWHDYCPTEWELGCKYSMFEDTIKMVFDNNAEFVTAAGVNERLHAFEGAKLEVSYNDGISITANVSSTGSNSDLAAFSLDVGADQANGEVIASVENWYAYDKKRVFIDADGGSFKIWLGASVDPVTHISKLPMRARLTSLIGDNTNIEFNFEGEGEVEVTLSQNPDNFNITGADSVTMLGANVVVMKYNKYGNHLGNITLK